MWRARERGFEEQGYLRKEFKSLEQEIGGGEFLGMLPQLCGLHPEPPGRKEAVLMIQSSSVMAMPPAWRPTAIRVCPYGVVCIAPLARELRPIRLACSRS